MNPQTTAELTILLIYSILAFLGIVLAAWIFSIFFQAAKSRKLLRIQVALMIKIAEKAGVTKYEIDSIVNNTLPKSDPLWRKEQV